MSLRRRVVLIRLGAVAAAAAGPAHALQRRSLDDPLRVAVDDALADSGLAAALQRAFARDTGVALQLLRGPATSVLQALERGEHDVAITNTPAAEEALEKQGLIHDRHAVGRSDFVLVGPTPLAKPLAAPHDLALAAARLAQAQAPFLTRHDGGGTHLMELAMWTAARVAPAAPWYRQSEAGVSVLAQARERRACALVERGVWASQGASKGFGVLSEGDRRFGIDVHVMRSFRAQHPAGRLFVGWITGPKGRQHVAGHRGYVATGA
jgi:tungstate transport system substrate-binding protein